MASMTGRERGGAWGGSGSGCWGGGTGKQILENVNRVNRVNRQILGMGKCLQIFKMSADFQEKNVCGFSFGNCQRRIS